MSDRKAWARTGQIWTEEDHRIIQQAVRMGFKLEIIRQLMPHRSYHSIKDVFYRYRQPAYTQDKPIPVEERDSQKSAVEGSRMLLEAIMRHHPEQVRHTGRGSNENCLRPYGRP